MPPERQRIRGMQDPRLEAKRNSTPPVLTESQPRESRGQTMARLIRGAVEHQIVIEGKPADPKILLQAQDGAATVRDEFRATFLNREMPQLDDLRVQVFDALVDTRVAKHYQKERDAAEQAAIEAQVKEHIVRGRARIAGDWKEITAEFPGQFPEAQVVFDPQLDDLRIHYGTMSKGFK